MQPQILTQEVGDADLQYLHFAGAPPTVICLHATGFLPWLWLPIARELTDKCQIIAPYFCHHRDTDPEKGGLSWMLLAEDLVKMCKALEIQRPYFVGHSMGATIALLANHLMNNSAEKMVLIEPILLPEEIYEVEFGVEDHSLASKSIKRRNHWKDREEARTYFKSKALFENWDDEMLDLYVEHGTCDHTEDGVTLACSPRREASLFMGSRHYNPWPLLSEVACPTKIIAGGNSEYESFIDLKRIAKTIPEGTYTSVEGAGHLVTMENPKAISGLIRDHFFE